MAEMVDMARSKKDREAELTKYDSVESVPDYPYGLTLSLSDGDVKKLGLENCEADDVVTIEAEGFVSEASSNVIGGKTSRRVSIQIKKLYIMKGDDEAEDKAETLYSDK